MLHSKDIVTSSYAQIRRRFECKSLTGLSTGFVDYDCLTGGLQAGELLIVAARPGVGTTRLCLNFALNIGVGQRIPIAWFSLDVSREQIVQRMAGTLAEVDSNRIRTGYLYDTDWFKLDTAFSELGNSPIHVHDSTFIGASAISEECKKLIQEGTEVKLVFVDPVAHMSDGEKSVSLHLEELKSVAVELNVAVVAACHVASDLEERNDKRPRLLDLREAGVANVVGFIYSDEFYNPESLVRGEVELIIARNRDGQTGTLDLMCNHSTGKLRDKNVF